MTRRRFTERQVLETLWRQGTVLRCYRCMLQLLPDDAEREHLTEIALGGFDVPANCVYSHKDCHAAITNGTKATSAGSSKQRIAKARRSPAKFQVTPRVCGQKRTPTGKIKSRGFRK